MRNDFLLPDLGEGLTEAAIVSWLVSAGDTIRIDQPVVEVESAKSVVELPSPFGGIVDQLFGEPGQTIHAGQVLLTVTDSAATPVSEAAGPAKTTAGSSDVAAASGTAEASGAVLIGYGTTASTRPARRPQPGRFGAPPTAKPVTIPATPVAAPVAAPVSPAAVVVPEPRHVAAPDQGRRGPVVSPLVRRLARENGFDASRLPGTGPDGLVTRADVQSHIRLLGAPTVPAPHVSPSAPAAPAARAAVASSPAQNVRIPITGLRKVVAQRLATSRREIPEATIWLDVDATELFVARDRLLTATGQRFSVTALIARFVVAGLGRFPLLNSSVDTASQEILQYGAVNLGIAAQTSRGLMVPVVHGAHAMTTRQLRDAIADLVVNAVDGTFAPASLSGGTFTLNNFGALGVDGSAAIINHPEAAILGIGRMIERPWVVNHQLAVRTVVELSMVFDHRVCDGGTAAGFLTFVAQCIENPVALLAEV